MKGYLYTYLLTLLGGVLLVVLHGREGLFEAIAIIAGIMFLVPGVIAIARAATASRRGVQGGEPLMWIVGGVAALFGLLLIVAPHMFTNFLFYAFAILMILAGAAEISNFAPGMKALGLSWIYMPVPVLCIAAGIVVILLGAEKMMSLIALVTGIVMIASSINGLIGWGDRYRRLKHGGVTGHIVEVG